MLVDKKAPKSNLGCALSGRRAIDVPAMLPERAPTIVPPRAPTMVPLRLARAPTIVPPRAVDETLIVSTAIQRANLKRLISFSSSVIIEWALAIQVMAISALALFHVTGVFQRLCHTETPMNDRLVSHSESRGYPFISRSMANKHLVSKRLITCYATCEDGPNAVTE
jgi:hypothetical protein